MIVGGLLDIADPPTAILASDSNVAIDVLLALKSRDVVVPDALSVITLDDAPWARISSPPLTAIMHPIYQAGSAAGKAAIRLIEGLPLPAFDLTALLILRDSHAAPPPMREAT